MKLQLGHVLAGLAARGGKPQRQGLINDLAACRIADARQRLDDLPPPGLGAVADQSLKLPECLPALRRRLRGDQIREPLHFRQIEPPVGESAARELAGLREPAALRSA